MSKIKHYDSTTKTWVIDGASSADNIELINSEFVDDLGNSISVKNGFTKVGNRLTKLEQNLAWVYLNGAKGGGGGTSTSDTYTLTIAEGSKVYTTSGSVTLTVLVSGGTATKTCSIAFVDSGTSTTLKTVTAKTKTNQTITLTGITSTTTLQVQATIGTSITDAVYIKVISGALALKLTSLSNTITYIGNSTKLLASFALTNTSGNDATFTLSCENITLVNTTYSNSATITQNIRDLSKT